MTDADYEKEFPGYIATKELGDIVNEKWPDHFNGCQISTIGKEDSNAPDCDKEKPAIVIMLQEELPENAVPKEYKGLRVFTKVTQRVRFLLGS
jgi:hypothetical protein